MGEILRIRYIITKHEYTSSRVSWRGSEWPVIRECNRKLVFVIVFFIIGHDRNRAQDTPLAAYPPRPVFYGLAVTVSKFWV